MESVLVRKFDIPKKFHCTVAATTEISVFSDKVLFGKYEFLYKNVIAIRPSKERDGFYLELEDAVQNPIIKEKIVQFHILKSGLFGGKAAKKLGMEIYTIIYDAVCKFQKN